MTKGKITNMTFNGSIMKSLIYSLPIMAALVTLSATPASAVIQTYTDLASWQAAVGSTTLLEDFEAQTEDVFFGTGTATSPNGQLELSANANFSDNAVIDVDPFVSTGAGINGDVVVNMRFLDGGAGANPQETVTVNLLPGINAFAFEYNNYDTAGDGTFLSFEGTNAGTVAAFDSTVNGFFGVVDTDPGATISSFSFTGDPAVGTGFSAFNSFDDVRYDEPDLLTLRINTGSGLTEIVNDTATPYEIDYYKITSSTDDLNFSSWSSLSDQELDAIDGLDGGSTAGDGLGETWDEAGGSDDGVLSERFLLGSSLFDSRVESLGNAFKVGGDTDSLTFEYRRTSDGRVFTGDIELVAGFPPEDLNMDGFVDGLDLGILLGNWNNPSATPLEGELNGTPPVDGLDLGILLGAWNPAPASATAAVPEPGTCILLVMAGAMSLLARPSKQ